jgi:AraC family transcriptional regulator
MNTQADIPGLWARFAPRMDGVAGRVTTEAFGVVSGVSDPAAFDYLAGVAVDKDAKLPPDFARIELPARRYAVFAHQGHVSKLPATAGAIFADWLPASGEEAAGPPDFFERYGEAFDPKRGEGDIEVWLPLKG